MEKRQLRIDVLGTSFVIQSEESAEHLNRLAAYVRGKIEEVKSRYNFAEPLTVSILAALNIADELFKSREGREPQIAVDEISSVAEMLISRIDDDLLKHTPYADHPDSADPQGTPSGES
jgi:cell division protein ZapA